MNPGTVHSVIAGVYGAPLAVVALEVVRVGLGGEWSSVRGFLLSDRDAGGLDRASLGPVRRASRVRSGLSRHGT